MMAQLKITEFLFFILALVGYQTDGNAAQKSPGPALPLYHLAVSFDLKNNQVRGTAAITAASEAGVATVSPGGLRIVSVKLNGVAVTGGAGDNVFKIRANETLEIEYEGNFKAGPGSGENLENPGVVQAGLVSDQGISLTNGWYPQIDGLAYYQLTALVPADFTAISEADEITSRQTGSGREYSFIFSHPLSGVDLVAGHYQEFRDSIDGIELHAYFFPEDATLAANYRSCQKLLQHV